MGDHRASIKIEFTIHEKTYNCEMPWINYWPDSDGVDERVREFFVRSWDDAKRRYDEKIAKWEAEREAETLERRERAELERLKSKYGCPETASGDDERQTGQAE